MRDLALPCKSIHVNGVIDGVIAVDQTPIGRSPRSNPATYLKLWDDIRKVFAETVEAKVRNFTPGHFSFNTDGGRCETCRGEGALEIDLQATAEMYIPCPDCKGTRFQSRILEIRYRNCSIADVLDMTVEEAFRFFRGQAKLQQKLKRLMDVGLEYLPLGQPTRTLSGGESQRLKLAAHLSVAKKGRMLFLLDEPTTGLHPEDIKQLLNCFDSLLQVGHSFIVIEHDPRLIRAADHVIELGPGAADEGGYLLR